MQLCILLCKLFVVTLKLRLNFKHSQGVGVTLLLPTHLQHHAFICKWYTVKIMPCHFSGSSMDKGWVLVLEVEGIEPDDILSTVTATTMFSGWQSHVSLRQSRLTPDWLWRQHVQAICPALRSNLSCSQIKSIPGTTATAKICVDVCGGGFKLIHFRVFSFSVLPVRETILLCEQLPKLKTACIHVYCVFAKFVSSVLNLSAVSFLCVSAPQMWDN